MRSAVVVVAHICLVIAYYKCSGACKTVVSIFTFIHLKINQIADDFSELRLFSSSFVTICLHVQKRKKSLHKKLVRYSGAPTGSQIF